MDSIGQIIVEFLFYTTGELLVRCLPSSWVRGALFDKPKSVEIMVRGKRKKRGKYAYHKHLKAAGKADPHIAWSRAKDGAAILGADAVALIGLVFWLMVIIGGGIFYRYWFS
jgi:uncharacterized membrane-anchored protein